MLIGSLFSGIGGLDLAAEYVTGGRVLWQVEHDSTPAKILAQRWPDAELLQRDICTVQPADLARVDLLLGGFPCQDLSCAGKRAGLDGARSGLYKELLRIADGLRPPAILIENVRGLLPYMPRVEADLQQLGYRVTWTTCLAQTAGSPQKRMRVFVLAWQPGSLPDFVRAYRAPAWPAKGHLWPTPAATRRQDGEGLETWLERHERVAQYSRPISPPLPIAAQFAEQQVPWPTPKARDSRSGTGTHAGNLPSRQGGRDLPEVLKGRLNPDWVETLMGFPVGWTQQGAETPHGLARLHDPLWPAGWVRQDPSAGPQHDWEPPRLLHGQAIPGRPGRLRALGNAVCPHQGAHALTTLLAQAAFEEIAR